MEERNKKELSFEEELIKGAEDLRTIFKYKLKNRFQWIDEDDGILEYLPSSQLRIAGISDLYSAFLSIYSAKLAEETTGNMIKSNEKLSKTNEKYAKGMYFMTGAIVVMTLTMIVIAIIK